ncbi:MAG: glycosyltransferase [Anaerolineae bacterium]
MELNIFHGPENIAGSAGVLAKAQRASGVDAFAYCLPTSFHYPADRILRPTDNLGYTLQLLTFLTQKRWRFNIFQFYHNSSLALYELWDVPWLKKMSKKVFFYFCGCDARDSKLTIQKYEINACQEHWPMACSPNRKKAIDYAQRYADGVFVSTPDLLEFVPGSTLIPQPLDLEQFTPLRDQAWATARSRSDASDKFVIAHAPSNPMIKGTIYLERAVQELQASGYSIELLLIQNTPYQETLRLAAQADVIVDQLLVGAYGTFAVEMMALGKPVICYIRDDLRRHYPANLPIISASPKTIGQALKDLIEQRSRWPEIGQQGIQYVNQVHDSLVIARQTLSHYQRSFKL